MKKTVTINISGIIFHIDDDAYDRLSRYLNSIKRHFSGMEGRDEIVSDIESRIAELLQAKITENKQVITIEDIGEVVKLMGQPTEMDEEPDHQVHEEKSAYHHRPTKRLYRDIDNRTIGGVATGLANYFNIDPVWIKVAFIVSFLVWGTGILVYIILWMAVPAAVTTAEKLEMRGEQVNISTIERSIRDEFDGVKGKFNEFTEDARHTFKNKGIATRTFFDKLIDFIAAILRVIFRAAVIVIGVILVLAGLGFIIFLVGGSIGFSSFSFMDNGHLNSFSLANFLQMVFSNGTISFMAVLSLALLFIIPLLMLIYLGLRMLFGRSIKVQYFGRSALGLWLIGLLLAIIVGIDTGMDFRHTSRVVIDYSINAPKDKILYIDANINDEVVDDFNTNEFFDGYWKIKKDNHDHQIFGTPWINFKPGSGEKTTAAVISYAQGSNREEAGKRAGNMMYNVSTSDTMLTISSHFQFPDNDKIRAQRLEIEIEIPVGQKVILTEKMKTVIEDGKNWEYRESDLFGKVLIMTNRGLKPFTPGMSLFDESGQQYQETEKIISKATGINLTPVIQLLMITI